MGTEYSHLIAQLERLSLFAAAPQVAYVFDEAMTEHCGEKSHPERPDRIRTIHDHFVKEGLVDRARRIDSRLATKSEVMLAHSEEMVDAVFKIESDPNLIGGPESSDVLVKQKQLLFPFDNDTYVCHSSSKAARLACGSVLSLIDAVMEDPSTCIRGFAAIRPPGHHAGSYKSRGFCLFNNVAVAANYARRNYGLERVVVLDFDVHHGNGTSEIFYDDRGVLFMSIHRYDKGKFYPGTGHLDDIGIEAGRGFNINMPVDGSYGDEEMWYCWDNVVIPGILNFKPELVLVSAGFDAAENDPLGLCHVRCSTYGRLIESLIETIQSSDLMDVSRGRIALVLEGGYNLESIAAASSACMQALLNMPVSGSTTASGISSPSAQSVSGISVTSARSIRSIPGGVPKTSLVAAVHKLTKLLNSVKDGVQVPITVDVLPFQGRQDRKAKKKGSQTRQPPPELISEKSFLLHSGGGHPGAVVRFDDQHVIKKTTVREALCYLLIAEATGQRIEIEVTDKSISVGDLLRAEEKRVNFEAKKQSFVTLSRFTCICKKIFFESLSSVSVVLADQTFGLVVDESLGVLDIKLGTEYHTPEDLPDRILTRRQKAEQTSAGSLGIRVTACKCMDGFTISKHRAAKLKRIEQMVPMVRRFLYCNMEEFELCVEAASSFSEELLAVFESREIDFRFIASSILIVTGRDAISGLVQLRVKMVDLAHLFPNPEAEEGLLLGLRNMRHLLVEVRAPSYESA